MSERRSFWQRLFGRTRTSSLSQRQQKVLHYIIGRIDENVPLQEVLQEDLRASQLLPSRDRADH
jgi:hypothetical protein